MQQASHKPMSVHTLFMHQTTTKVLRLEGLRGECRWETGYWRSMDIMHDRAGYYICWGCLVWVPAVYTSPAMYLTMHGVNNLSAPAALAIACAGTAAIYINYDSDRQRQVWA